VHRRLLGDGDDDPLGSVANLFDVAMVFAVALMLALVVRFPALDLLSADNLTVVKNAGQPNMEIIVRRGKRLTRYRMTRETLGGEGERLGTAYRLKTGEVVYVPDQDR